MRRRAAERARASATAAALAVFAVLAQLALPSLHAWEVALEESGRHCPAALHASGGGALVVGAGTAEAHQGHHQDASCPVCRVLSSARPATAPAAARADAPAHAGGSARVPAATPLAAAGGSPASPRAPPSLLA